MENNLNELVAARIQHAIATEYERNREKLQTILADDLSIQTIQAAVTSWSTGKVNNLEEMHKLACAEGSTEYFPAFMPLSDNEFFIDGGGYNGYTTIQFINKVKNKYNKIHIFEPIQQNYEQALSLLKKHQIDFNKVTLQCAGLFSSAKEAKFSVLGASSTMLNLSGKTETCRLVKFDDVFSEKERSEITYIKLDIEGAEPDALEGMKETITQYKPKLAICIYHRPMHLWQIPLYIHELNPEYKIYVRHHSNIIDETVLYAMN
jgi:FkbM family methyltransferase